VNYCSHCDGGGLSIKDVWSGPVGLTKQNGEIIQITRMDREEMEPAWAAPVFLS